jgi:hypothetical protein
MRPSNAPRRISMTPELYILLAGKPEEVGPALNAMRVKLVKGVKAVLTDATLLAAIGSNGSIRYDGCATGLSWGREMIGDMGVSISFLYFLQPEKLPETDIREVVLIRLVEIAAGIEGVTTAKRNIKRPADNQLPAIVVLDADEAAEETDP